MILGYYKDYKKATEVTMENIKGKLKITLIKKNKKKITTK